MRRSLQLLACSLAHGPCRGLHRDGNGVSYDWDDAYAGRGREEACLAIVALQVFLRTYRIVYRGVDDGIVVLTVFEGNRPLGTLDPDHG